MDRRNRDQTTAVGHHSEESHGASGARVLVAATLFPEVHSVVLTPGAGPWKIGRGACCALQSALDSVSREHAEISLKGPVIALRDLGSTNGTFLNGAKIEHAPLKVGSVFRCGQLVAMLLSVSCDAVLHEAFGHIGPDLFGGPTLRSLLQAVERIAATDLPVLLEGPTGTGKERVARLIHERSGRAGAFQAINCAALPTELADSELFGHRQGAFTGALHASAGRLRAADGGTLFLDEIEDLPLPVQAKLLRAIQEQEVTPVGCHKPIRVNVRFVSACQRPLETRVDAQSFREDLYARLAGFVFRLPALAERREEVPGLFGHFLRKHSRGAPPEVDALLIERLCLYDWPRNVRELENLVRQLLALHGHEGRLKRSHLPEHLGLPSGSTAARDERTRSEISRLVHALRDCSGNVSQACAKLGISRSRAYRLMGDRTVDQVMAESSGVEREVEA